ncbi:MAG: hypothetical protein ACI8QS_001917 [Planctomycetota bacterium]
MILVRLLAGILLLTGCASYPARTSGALRDFRSGHFLSSAEAYVDEDLTGSGFLSGAEAGTVALAAGSWEQAIEYFEGAANAAGYLDERGALSRDNLVENLGSWALNDRTQAYRGEGFERVYVHASMALAYLALGKLDDVYVEARLSNDLLEAEEKLYEKEYAAGGLGHFVSALAYELLGQPDEAYIDYSRMAQKNVGTSLAGPALLRLGASMQRTEDMDEWRERFGTALALPPDSASIVVIAGVGLAPFKIESSLVVPGRSGLVAVAVPSFRERQQFVGELHLSDAVSGAAVLTDVLERVDEVGIANLEDRLLYTAAKSVARGLAKRELTRNLEDSHGTTGRLAGDIFALLSERADLRSWTTLPASWQAARMWVPPGEVDLVLEAIGGQSLNLGRYAVEPGETIIIIARSLDTRLHAHAIGGAPLAEPQIERLEESLPLTNE